MWGWLTSPQTPNSGWRIFLAWLSLEHLQAVSDMLSGRSDRGLFNATEPHLDQKYVGSQMFLFPVALGSSRGQEDFYATKNPACSSLLEPDVKTILAFGAGASCGESEVYQVAVLTLWHLLSKIPWGSEGDPGVFPIVEHIKTDAQGYDVEVLRGAGRYLSERVVCVTAEKYAWGYKETGHSEEDLIDFMYHEGFVLSHKGIMFQYHEVFALEDTDMDLTFYNTNLFDWWEDVDCSASDSFVNSFVKRGKRYENLRFPANLMYILRHKKSGCSRGGLIHVGAEMIISF
jgi:hypothetical protein